MTTINHKLAQAVMPPAQASGTVTHCFADGSVTVESEGRGWHCRRAVSCLIAPQAGDRVLREHEKPRGSHRMMPSTGVKITTIIS